MRVAYLILAGVLTLLGCSGFQPFLGGSHMSASRTPQRFNASDTVYYSQENNSAADVFAHTLWNGNPLPGQPGLVNGQLTFAYWYPAAGQQPEKYGFSSAASATNGAASRSGLTADGNGVGANPSGFDFVQGGGSAIGVSLSPRTVYSAADYDENLVAAVGFAPLIDLYSAHDTLEFTFNADHPYAVSNQGLLQQTGVMYYYSTIVFQNKTNGDNIWLTSLVYQDKCAQGAEAQTWPALACQDVFFVEPLNGVNQGYIFAMHSSHSSILTPCPGSSEFSTAASGPSTFCFTFSAAQFTAAVQRLNSAQSTKQFSTVPTDYAIYLAGLNFESIDMSGTNPQMGLNFSGMQLIGTDSGTTASSGGGTSSTGGSSSSGGSSGAPAPSSGSSSMTIVYEWTQTGAEGENPSPSYISFRGNNPPAPWQMVGGVYRTFDYPSPTRSALYVCQRGSTWDFFSSLDPNCEGQTYFGMNGYVEMSQTSQTNAIAYRCTNGSAHLDTTIPNQVCVGSWRVDGVLGWVFD